MNRQHDQGILDQLLKAGRRALPAIPVLGGCLLLMIWISFGIRVLVVWIGDPASQSGQFFQFIADPFAALVGSLLLTYLIKSNSTRGGKLLGLLAILFGLFFTTVLYSGMPSISPLLIFQILLTYLLGWFGGSIASGQFAERLKYSQGLGGIFRLNINPRSRRYHTLLTQLGGDDTAARRLIARERAIHPNHSSEQLVQDAIDSLSRDRSRT